MITAKNVRNKHIRVYYVKCNITSKTTKSKKKRINHKYENTLKVFTNLETKYEFNKQIKIRQKNRKMFHFKKLGLNLYRKCIINLST